MAHSLKLRVIAEGVETEEQRQFLRDEDCAELQGYAIGRPAPVETLGAWTNHDILAASLEVETTVRPVLRRKRRA